MGHLAQGTAYTKLEQASQNKVAGLRLFSALCCTAMHCTVHGTVG